MTETSSLRPGLGAPPPEDTILDVRNLRTYFKVMDGTVPAVDGTSFSLGRGQTLGIVGESGSGKSVTAMTIMRLLDIPPAVIGEGSEIWFDGREVLSLPDGEMRRIRGNEMAMIFQEPLTSLNPVFTVGDQIAEQVKLHKKVKDKEAKDRAIEMLRLVGINSPERRAKQYPHELSGGMRQRVMIGMALSCEPKMIIADEPTTALDVSIQAQIITLLKRLCRDNGTAIMLVTHDMGVIAETADRVAVMYAGRVVEIGPVQEVIHNPQHPYTTGLMGSIPAVGQELERLPQIEGSMPRLNAIPAGCPFNPRCPRVFDRCKVERPNLLPADNSLAACWLHAPEMAAPGAPKDWSDGAVHA